MKDDLLKYKKQLEITESIFESIFKKKTSQPDPRLEHLKKYGFYRDDAGFFVFTNGNVVDELNNNEPSLVSALENMNLYQNSKLNFLVAPGTTFHASYMKINVLSEEVDVFEGDWSTGGFRGGLFKGIFEGKSFQGNFQGRNLDYRASGDRILSFVDGTFLGGNGILGLEDTVNSNTRNFNFITIPVGYSLKYISNSGIEGYIKVLKRLDGSNSEFAYEIMDGFVGDKTPRIVHKNWQYFRDNAPANIFEIDTLHSKNFGGLVQVLAGDSIKQIFISAAPQAVNTAKPKFEPGKKYAFDLSTLPFSKQIEKIFRGSDGKMRKSAIDIEIDSSEELAQFDYIKSGSLKKDLKYIRAAIEYGEVDGYGPYAYLSTIFNNVKGVNTFSLSKPLSEVGGQMYSPSFTAPVSQGKTYKSKKGTVNSAVENTITPENTALSMKRLNDFVKYFISNIQKPVQMEVINKIKHEIGSDKIKVNTTTPASTQAANTGKGNKPGYFGSMTMKESLKINVRNIINNNF